MLKKKEFLPPRSKYMVLLPPILLLNYFLPGGLCLGLAMLGNP